MKFPNKVISYKESVISKFPYILNVLKAKDMEPIELYSVSRKKFENVTEFVDVIVCLNALGKVVFSKDGSKLHYVD